MISPRTPSRKYYQQREKISSLGSGKGKIFFSEKRITIETEDGTLYYVFHTKALWYTHGDLVEYTITRPSKDGKLAEVKPTKLIKRSNEELLMRISNSQGKVVYRILESLGGSKVVCEVVPEQLSDGDIFIVRFIGNGIVTILRYFWSEKDPRIMEEIIFFRAGVRLSWPETFNRLKIPEAPKLNTVNDYFDFDQLLPNGEKISNQKLFTKISIYNRERLDLRHWSTMTIDGADAKDLDDAISIARYENGDYLLGIHIADVAEYVEEGSDLDHEAYLRGTSIYTPGRVIPMLPEILSNDLCSLHPGSPKLTLSILLHIDSIWQVKESYVAESVIESMNKWIYDEVWEDLQKISHGENLWNEQSLGEEILSVRWERENKGQSGEVFLPSKLLKACGHKSIVNHYSARLNAFHFLYKILEKRRKNEGKILFETTECYFELDEERNIKNIKKRERNEAHMMIEEFMVLANEEIAKWCVIKKIPFLSRIHEAPSAEKTREIQEIIALSTTDHDLWFISIREDLWIWGDITPHDIRAILEKAREDGDLYRLSRLLLPKMAKAVYRETIDRHFGLALKYYAHFTSPIRRYPDLLLHRMIKKYLHGELSKEKSTYEKNMKKWGLSLSEKERSAEDVSRAIDALYMCRYMSDKVGSHFEWRISWLTESNIYVELPSGVEGAVFLKWGNTPKITWWLILDSTHGALIDRKWKILYQIGQSIDVKIREVDMINRRIEMTL